MFFTHRERTAGYCNRTRGQQDYSYWTSIRCAARLYAWVKNRSSVAAKRSLIVGACVVDSGYDGEVFVNLHNVGKETQYLRAADKIAQLVLILWYTLGRSEAAQAIFIDNQLQLATEEMVRLGVQMDKSTQKTMFSSKTGNWATPQEVFDKLNWRFGPFDLDPCASTHNTKCANFFTEAENGLEKDWQEITCFVNPPYGRGIDKWFKKHIMKLRNQTQRLLCLFLPGQIPSIGTIML